VCLCGCGGGGGEGCKQTLVTMCVTVLKKIEVITCIYLSLALSRSS